MWPRRSAATGRSSPSSPRQFDAIHGLGVLEAQRGRYDEALRLVGQALEINPQSIDAKRESRQCAQSA